MMKAVEEPAPLMAMVKEWKNENGPDAHHNENSRKHERQNEQHALKAV